MNEWMDVTRMDGSMDLCV